MITKQKLEKVLNSNKFKRIHKKVFVEHFNNYYNTKHKAIELLQEILNFENKDKNFFINLLNISKKTGNVNLLNNIYLYCNYYFKSNVLNKQLKKEEQQHFKIVYKQLKKQLKEKEQKQKLFKNVFKDTITLHILSNTFKIEQIQSKLKLNNKTELNEKLDKYKKIKEKTNYNVNNLQELKLELKNLINKNKK